MGNRRSATDFDELQRLDGRVTAKMADLFYDISKANLEQLYE